MHFPTVDSAIPAQVDLACTGTVPEHELERKPVNSIVCVSSCSFLPWLLWMVDCSLHAREHLPNIALGQCFSTGTEEQTRTVPKSQRGEECLAG